MEEESNLADISTLVKMFSLRQLVLHELTRKIWDGFILRETLSDNISAVNTEKLVSHRLKLSGTIFHRKFPGLPAMFRGLLAEALVCWQQGFSEALAWENRCKTSLPFTVLNPLTAGPYWAGHFINPAGQFDDLTWAKRFVADETQPALCRFKLACFYCFEDILITLWHRTETCSELHKKFTQASSSTRELDSWWAFWLKNSGLECANGKLIPVDSGFYASGLRKAFSTSHEYATRFFWEHCSLSEKTEFLSKFKYSNLIDAAMHNNVRFILFIYSLLPIEQKICLITWTAICNAGSCVWYCLFQSPFYKVILDDIFTFPRPIPAKFYEKIFSTLVDLIEKLKIPAHKEIYKALWQQLSPIEKEGVFKFYPYILGSLVGMDDIDMLQMVIELLPRHLKEKVLLPIDGYNLSGLAPVRKYSNLGDYDSLFRYLLIFLIDRDPITENPTLRTDAADLLDSFMKNRFFLYWLEEKCTEPQRNEVIHFMEVLLGSLGVVTELVHQTEEEHCRAAETIQNCLLYPKL